MQSRSWSRGYREQIQIAVEWSISTMDPQISNPVLNHSATPPPKEDGSSIANMTSLWYTFHLLFPLWNSSIQSSYFGKSAFCLLFSRSVNVKCCVFFSGVVTPPLLYLGVSRAEQICRNLCYTAATFIKCTLLLVHSGLGTNNFFFIVHSNNFDLN